MRSRFRGASLFAGGLGALLHKLREGSGLAPLDQVVEKRLTVLGVRLQQNLVDPQCAFDTGLILGETIILLVGILDEKGCLRERLRDKDDARVFLIALGQLVENHAHAYVYVGNLDDPPQHPFAFLDAAHYGLPRATRFRHAIDDGSRRRGEQRTEAAIASPRGTPMEEQFCAMQELENG